MYIAQSITGLCRFPCCFSICLFYNPHRLSLVSCQRQETGIIHAQRGEARRKRWKLPAGPPKKVVENSVALCHRLLRAYVSTLFEPRVTAVCIAFYGVFHIYYHYQIPLFSFSPTSSSQPYHGCLLSSDVISASWSTRHLNLLPTNRITYAAT